MEKVVDVIVVGGGPGGYSTAMRAAQAGLETVCVEREEVGGVCLNWGCIPSKALISVGQRAHWARTSQQMGVHADGVRVDMVQAQKHNREIVHHHTRGVTALLQHNGVGLLRGSACLTSPVHVRVESECEGPLRLRARRGIVLATGARPRQLEAFTPDGARILTAKEAVFLDAVPEHLIVLGGGVIGVELGSAYAALGARLSIVELSGALLPGIDADLTAVVKKRLERAGTEIYLQSRALSFEHSNNGVTVCIETPTGERSLAGSHVLVAAGFVPHTDGLGLESAGVALDERGHIRTKGNCQTSVPGIYAIGDVAGPPYLAHKAFAESLVVADALAGRSAQRDWRALPAAIFSDPEIAVVGLSEEQAKQQGRSVEIGRFPFSASGRAMARLETDGFVKLISEAGRLVGAGIVGAEASELIAELTLAIEVGASLEDLSLTIHPHPTLSEAVHDAADHGLGRAVHVANRRKRVQAPLGRVAS